MPVVFVNYRVQEQPGYATLIHRELSQRFGADAVFLASRSIRPGEDYVSKVFDSLRRCTVLLAVIGPQWSEFHGKAHLFDEPGTDHDWVHREIAEAFAVRMRVIPVLVEDAQLPVGSGLPPDIAALARCQYLRLRHYSIESDLALLINEVERVAPALTDRAAHRPPSAVPPRRSRSRLRSFFGVRGDVDGDADGSAGHPQPVEAMGGRPTLFRVGGAGDRSCRIGVVPGTIRRVTFADIWVNSENTGMEMARFTEFSVSGIIRYWGATRDDTGRVVDDVIADQLAIGVGDQRPVAPCTAVVTGAGALTATNNVRHLIHVAAVHGEPGAGYRQVRNIEWCVTNALAKAEQLAGTDDRVRSILFPLLGTGVAGADIEATVRAMLQAALDHLGSHPDTRLTRIFYLAYRETEMAAFRTVLRQLPELVQVFD